MSVKRAVKGRAQSIKNSVKSVEWGPCTQKSIYLDESYNITHSTALPSNSVIFNIAGLKKKKRERFFAQL